MNIKKRPIRGRFSLGGETLSLYGGRHISDDIFIMLTFKESVNNKIRGVIPKLLEL